MKSRNLLASALLIASFSAHASDAYETNDDAGIAALKTTLHASEKAQAEYGGLVYQFEGKFYFTDAVTDGTNNEVTIRGKMPKGSKLSGIYHTHPAANDIANIYSQADLQIAKKLNVTSYVLPTKSGHILSYTAGVDTTKYGHVIEVIQTGHSLCHNMECVDYYKLVQHAALVMAGQAR